MNAVIDTCVIVDALQDRILFGEAAKSIFLFCANRQCEGLLTAKAITDIYYLTHRQTHDDKAIRDIITKLCTIFGLLDTTALDIRKAILSETSDFEDAVMIETTVRYKVDCIVTRDTKDYSKSSIHVYTPDELLKLLVSTNKDE